MANETSASAAEPSAAEAHKHGRRARMTIRIYAVGRDGTTHIRTVTSDVRGPWGYSR